MAVPSVEVDVASEAADTPLVAADTVAADMVEEVMVEGTGRFRH